MCVLIISYNILAETSLVLAANRDEFHQRPARPLSYWTDKPNILAGQDLKSDGTWLGITRQGRIAAVTNFRDPSIRVRNALSRGFLVRDFLESMEPPESYIAAITKTGERYNGFNLVVGDQNSLFYYSNRGNREAQRLDPGLYALSNHLMDTPWPKIKRIKNRFNALVTQKSSVRPEELFDILGDRWYPPENMLPDTGIGPEWEHLLSPIFITSATYGTRSSAVILIKKTGRITFIERTFDPKGNASIRKFRFTIRK